MPGPGGSGSAATSAGRQRRRRLRDQQRVGERVEDQRRGRERLDVERVGRARSTPPRTRRPGQQPAAGEGAAAAPCRRPDPTAATPTAPARSTLRRDSSPVRSAASAESNAATDMGWAGAGGSAGGRPVRDTVISDTDLPPGQVHDRTPLGPGGHARSPRRRTAGVFRSGCGRAPSRPGPALSCRGAVACTLWITPLAAAGGPPLGCPRTRSQSWGDIASGDRGPVGTAVVSTAPVMQSWGNCDRPPCNYPGTSPIWITNRRVVPPNYRWSNLGNMSFKIPAIFWIIWARIRSGWSAGGRPGHGFRRRVEAGLPGPEPGHPAAMDAAVDCPDIRDTGRLPPGWSQLGRLCPCRII